ncbi:chemotaxis-related protein [Thioploca ingrica]|uniref:Chemotaxis-related protein n=1 Tax=Thioploca ingrica TaxID=40754 RepID=A0A090AEZ8_9GAMM|nr:chemotaxis-related protein [Thioploca ingrica]
MSNSIAVRCLLVPIGLEQQLLLPSTVVAEVFPYQKPEPVVGSHPSWLLGSINWRGQPLLVMSMEKILSLPLPSSKPYRTLILYGLESNQTLPFYAFLVTDIPRTLNLTEVGLTHFVSGERNGIVFQVEIAQQGAAWILDLTYLENLLRKYQSHLSSPSVI